MRSCPHLAAGAAAVLALLLAACNSGPRERRNAVGRQVALEELSRMNTRMAPDASLAGVSAQGVSGIVPLRPRPLRDQADSSDFRHFVHRCNACHAAPDPSMHTAGEWAVVISRMKDNMRLAGLLPLRPQQERAIMEFLTRGAGLAP